MVTNQEMTVQIGNNNTIKIGHLTKVGSLNDVLTIGNSYRKAKELSEIDLKEWLRKESTWEFIIKVFNEETKKKSKGENPPLDIATIIREFPKDSKNRISYSEVMKSKQFKSVIKSQRGGKPENRGVWANLYILLDLATFLDVDLKYEMFEVFINSKILDWRDIGGDNFKELNKSIDTLPDRVGKNNKGVYIQIALILRTKLEIFETKGYNEEEHNSFIQKKRSSWLDNLTSMIDTQLITSYKDLKIILNKLR